MSTPIDPTPQRALAYPTREGTAHHEAAHVVAYLRFGKKIEYATIRVTRWGETESFGHVAGDAPTEWCCPPEGQPSTEAMKRRLTAEALVMLSGPVAEERAAGSDHWNPWCGSEPVDACEIGEVVAGEKWEAWFDEMVERTQDFVERYWPAVQAVAAALLERETLCGEECRRIALAECPELAGLGATAAAEWELRG